MLSAAKHLAAKHLAAGISPAQAETLRSAQSLP